MDIFEQYGIKEVADCTLYSIALDKNDNEIYIPVMYFDTLKLSSVEQSASSTSAKGGKDNSELITWNFGKEITINLTDALYTPASLSLLWGGKFGSKNAEINGFWNPIYQQNRAEEEIGKQQDKDKINKFKNQIKEYEDVINNIYEIIQNDEQFLYPYVNVNLYQDNFAHPITSTQFNPNEIYSLTGTYFPIADYVKKFLAQKVLEESSLEDQDLNNYTYSVNFNLQSEDDMIHHVISNKTYNAIKDIFNVYHVHESGPVVVEDPIRHPIELDELLLRKDLNLKNYLNILFGLDYSETIKIKYYPASLEDWKILANKELYDFDDLIVSCRSIFYNIISMQTEYKHPSSDFPIRILLENYSTYEENGVLKFKFNYIEKGYETIPIYTYTSEYLGYNKDDIKYPYILNVNDEPIDYSCKLFLPRVQKIGQPAERAKIILKNFSDFNTYIRQKGVNFHSRTLLDEIGINGIINFNNSEKEIFYEYEWKNCEIQMLSLEGNEDIYYANNIDILYRINSQNFERKILIKRDEDEDYYNSQIDFFTIKKVIQDNEVQDIKFKVGTFYINDSFNFNLQLENSIYSINSGAQDIHYLDRVEKCKAIQTFCIDTHKNFECNAKKDLPQYAQTELAIFLNPHTMRPYQPNTSSYIKKNGEIIYGNLREIKEGEIYYKWTRSIAKENEILGNEIVVTGYDFPGTYKLIANTYTRARVDGRDSQLQIEIPVCTILPESTIELSADGEPVTFNMQLKVMKNERDEMIKIQKFNIKPAEYDGYKSGSHEIIPVSKNNGNLKCEVCETPKINFVKSSDAPDMSIILPQEGEYYCFAIDCLQPFNGKESYLMLPITDEQAKNTYKAYLDYITLKSQTVPEDINEALNYQNKLNASIKTLNQERNKLLVKVYLTDSVIQIDGEPYLIARDGGYEFYNQESGTEEMTEEYDGKVYRIGFITQENLDRYSPIKFTFTGVNTE